MSLIWSPSSYGEQLQVVTPGGVTYTFTPGVPKDVAPEHHAYVKNILQTADGPAITPNAPAVAAGIGTGAGTWGYKVAAILPDGDSMLSPQGQSTNATTLASGTATEVITKPTQMPSQATGWRVVRSQSGGTPAGVNVDISGVLALSTASFTDTGIAGTAYTADVTVFEGPGEL